MWNTTNEILKKYQKTLCISHLDLFYDFFYTFGACQHPFTFIIFFKLSPFVIYRTQNKFGLTWGKVSDDRIFTACVKMIFFCPPDSDIWYHKICVNLFHDQQQCSSSFLYWVEAITYWMTKNKQNSMLTS